MRFTFLTMLAAAALLLPYQSLRAQYMYLDTNADGINTSADVLNLSGSTQVRVWLRTNFNKSGEAATCAGTGALNMYSYEFVIRVINGTLGWNAFTNHMNTFTISLSESSTPTEYHNGYAGGAPVVPGTYLLSTIAVTVGEGSPYLALSPAYSSNPFFRTSFGSDCDGVDFDNTLKLGRDWFDTGGAGTIVQWTPNGVKVADEPFGGQTQPTIASDGAGGSIIVWTDYRWSGGLPQTDLYAQRLDPTGRRVWVNEGVPINTLLSGLNSPQLVSDGTQGGYVAWHDDRSSTWDVYLQRINSNGGITTGWPAGGAPVATGAGHQYATSIVSDGPNGAIIGCVKDSLGTASPTVHKIDGTGFPTWTSNGVRVDSYGSGPVIANDGSGGAIVLWKAASGLRAQRISGAGALQWGWPGILVAPPVSETTITADGSGGAVLCWILSGKVYVQRINSSGVFQWGPNGIALCPSGGTQEGLRIVSDSFGGAVIAWHDNRASGPGLYMQAVSFSGAIKWNAAGIFAGGGQYAWQMTGDTFGGGILVWEGIGTFDSDVYAQRVSRDGIPLWGTNGKVICNSLRDNTWPNLVADSTGGAVAVWQDEREGIDIIYVHAMRIPAGGGQFVTGVDAAKSPEPSGSLYQNQPNPFNPTTVITYELHRDGLTTMIIYDVSGRVVRTLGTGWTSSGRHQVTWDGIDGYGRSQSSGVFYYRLVAPGIDEARKMVLLR